jgi:hypothetical protein
MKHPINKAAALPVTMDDDVYKAGIRDYLSYHDAKIPDSVELKEIFEFITSENKETKVTYENGSTSNYLPTKNFKISVNAAEVARNNVLPADMRNRIAKTLEWQYPADYVSKDQLALIDILVHNQWKRPIYFTNGAPNENAIGLRPYLYNEGFAYRLLPIKKNTADQQPANQTNTLVMYDNVMNKFKWGNMKHARLLDQQSTSLVYPFIINTFLNLSRNLAGENHADLAVKTLHRYDQVMPDIYPNTDIAVRKFYLADTAYNLKEYRLANKILSSVDRYIKDQLDYNYRCLQTDADTINPYDVQVSLSLLNEMAALTTRHQQLAVSTQVQQHLTEYRSKFASVIQQP